MTRALTDNLSPAVHSLTRMEPYVQGFDILTRSQNNPILEHMSFLVLWSFYRERQPEQPRLRRFRKDDWAGWSSRVERGVQPGRSCYQRD